MSEEAKQKISNSHLGLKHSVETKRKISEVKKGVPVHTEEHKEFLRLEWTGKNNPNFGKPISEVSKEKMRQTKANHPKLVCPHCNTSSNNPGPMKRWHFNNCKLIKQGIQ